MHIEDLLKKIEHLRNRTKLLKCSLQNLAEYLGTPNSSFVGYRAVIQQLVICILRNRLKGHPSRYYYGNDSWLARPSARAALTP